MSGWPAVISIIAVELAAAVFLIRVAARRWWDYLVIAALAVAFAQPIETYITGDVSRYLPAPDRGCKRSDQPSAAADRGGSSDVSLQTRLDASRGHTTGVTRHVIGPAIHLRR
jgi:hypothetical protein